MWLGQEEFEVCVTVDVKLFDRSVEPLRTKVKLPRKPAPEPGEPGGGADGKSKQ